jgi:hypothetical protein
VRGSVRMRVNSKQRMQGFATETARRPESTWSAKIDNVRRRLAEEGPLIKPDGSFGAGDGDRTRDIQLGKLTFYH